MDNDSSNKVFCKDCKYLLKVEYISDRSEYYCTKKEYIFYHPVLGADHNAPMFQKYIRCENKNINFDCADFDKKPVESLLYPVKKLKWWEVFLLPFRKSN